MIVSQSAIKMAPPFALVSKFFIAACFYLAIFVGILPFTLGSVDMPLLSFSYAFIVHLYLIGFVMMLIVGALYQLTPVVLEIPFSTLKLSNLVFWFLFFGAGFFALGFFLPNDTFLHVGAGLSLLSLTYFALTFLLSFKDLQEWNFVRFLLFSSAICLVLGLSFGFMSLMAFFGSIELDFVESWIQRHALFVFGGFVYFVILGVSMVLLPMFSLSHNFKDIFIKIASLFLALALLTSFLKIEFVSYFLSLSILFYVIQCAHILSLRVRKKKDYWFYNVAVALGFLFVAVCFLFFDVKMALFLVSFGYLYHFIIGHLYKILPFLVWYKYVSPYVGKAKIPMLHDMISEKFAYAQLFVSSFGTLVFACGLMLEQSILSVIGAIFILLASIFVLYNVYFMYKFKNFGEKL